MATPEKPPTLLSHGELPYPRGTLVEDTQHDRTGELVGVIEERLKESGKLLSRTAYVRPRGGGVEWDVPLACIRPVRADARPDRCVEISSPPTKRAGSGGESG